MIEDRLDAVRRSCAAVATSAGRVRIDYKRLTDYAATFPAAEAPASYDPAHHYLGDSQTTAFFVLTLDTVNFGSGWFPHLRKATGMSGYHTIATRLKERFESVGALSAGELTALDADDCAAIFGQVGAGSAADELMGLFARALSDLGRLLNGTFGGSPEALIAAAGGRAAGLVDVLTSLSAFRDVATYGGEEVAFYKRAQITAADLSLAFGGEGIGHFDDLDRLTIFADNLVPHVLRVDGVLLYDAALAEQIDRGHLVVAGSAEEVEIRACAVHAVELLRQELAGLGRPLRSMDLDHILWNRGGAPQYKAVPRHRARTVFY